MHTELLLGEMTDAVDVFEYYSIQTGAEGAKVRLPQYRQLWKLIQCYFLHTCVCLKTSIRKNWKEHKCYFKRKKSHSPITLFSSSMQYFLTSEQWPVFLRLVSFCGHSGKLMEPKVGVMGTSDLWPVGQKHRWQLGFTTGICVEQTECWTSGIWSCPGVWRQSWPGGRPAGVCRIRVSWWCWDHYLSLGADQTVSPLHSS